MRSLTDFLADLPGIMPRKARKLILEGDLLGPDLKSDIHERGDSFIDFVLEVGPDAAAAIVAAYKDERLPMQRGALPSAAPRAEEYVAGGDELRAQIAEKKRCEDAIKDPSLIKESDLSDDRLIDRVFVEQLGLKPGTLILDGISVSKTLARYSSNSGKSHGWGVTFTWTGSDGVKRTSGRTPPEADNRRNDEERSWGLPPR